MAFALVAGGCKKKDRDLTTDLHRAANRGNLQQVQMLIVRGARLNARDNRGRTPLYLAAQAGHKEVIEILARCGARVDCADDFGSTPVTMAMWQDRREMVECLVRAGATIDLDLAAYLGDVEQIQKLIDRGTSINGAEPGGWTPLHAAAGRGDLAAVKLLISHGADIGVADNSGMTPLYYAAYRGQPAVVEFLIECAADVDAEMGDKGQSATALGMAVSCGHIDVARYLAPKVKDINRKSKAGLTLLYDAVTAYLPPEYPHPEDGHLDRYPADRDDTIEPWEATRRLKMQMVELLLAHGADVNLRTGFGETPLHGAVGYADQYVAGLLLAHGADIDGAVEGGADVGPGPEDGETPLHYAAKWEQEEMVRFLIGHGAKVNARTKGGATPLLYALEMGNGSIARLLLAAGAEMANLKDLRDWPLLHKAWQAGDNELFEFLLRNGADVNERDGGETLLHRAACEGDLDLAKLLLK